MKVIMSTDAIEKDQNEGPIPRLQHVCHCQFSCWYPTFSVLPPNALRRTKGTAQARIIDLPDTFTDYLLADGIELPTGANTSSLLPSEDRDDGNWSNDDDNQGDTVKQIDPGIGHKKEVFSFPELDSAIAAAIDELGGAVAPKLNFSSPKDATWINSGSLKCQTPGDVYLLLKASDFCSYDVHYALQDVQDPLPTNELRLQLALRKWCNLYPSQEFRCFVRGQELIAISQRHHSQHFPHLARDRFLIRSIIVDFFDEIVQDKFAQGQVPNYIFDCYVDKNDKVWLLDFNVWGRRTDTLLFEWSELESIDPDQPEIRVVETEKQVRPDPLTSYRAPIDTIHVASMTGGDAGKFEEFMKLCERPSALQGEEDPQE